MQRTNQTPNKPTQKDVINFLRVLAYQKEKGNLRHKALHAHAGIEEELFP
jgi:hypothetical protein